MASAIRRVAKDEKRASTRGRASKKFKKLKPYGTSLEMYTSLMRAEVPEVVRETSRFIDKGASTEGLFIEDTKPQFVAMTSELKKKIDVVKKGSIVMLIPNVHVAAGALKAYLRELPEAPFTNDFFAELMEAMKLTDDAEQALTIMHIVLQFPKSHQLLISYLLGLLHRVLSVTTSHTSRSLATALASLFIRPPPQTAITNKEIQATISTLEILINHYPPLAGVEAPKKRKVPRSKASKTAKSSGRIQQQTQQQKPQGSNKRPSAKQTQKSVPAERPKPVGDHEAEPGGELELARLEDRIIRCENYPVTDLLPGSLKVLSVRALYDFEARKDTELNLLRGDVIEVTFQDDGPGWWEGIIRGKRGLFPSNYCECYELEKHGHRRRMKINTSKVAGPILLLQQALLENTEYDWDEDTSGLGATLAERVATVNAMVSKSTASLIAETVQEKDADTDETCTSASEPVEHNATEEADRKQAQVQETLEEELEEEEEEEEEETDAVSAAHILKLSQFTGFTELKSNKSPHAMDATAEAIVSKYSSLMKQGHKYYKADSARLDAELPVFEEEHDGDDIAEEKRTIVEEKQRTHTKKSFFGKNKESKEKHEKEKQEKKSLFAKKRSKKEKDSKEKQEKQSESDGDLSLSGSTPLEASSEEPEEKKEVESEGNEAKLDEAQEQEENDKDKTTDENPEDEKDEQNVPEEVNESLEEKEASAGQEEQKETAAEQEAQSEEDEEIMVKQSTLDEIAALKSQLEMEQESSRKLDVQLKDANSKLHDLMMHIQDTLVRVHESMNADFTIWMQAANGHSKHAELVATRVSKAIAWKESQVEKEKKEKVAQVAVEQHEEDEVESEGKATIAEKTDVEDASVVVEEKQTEEKIAEENDEEKEDVQTEEEEDDEDDEYDEDGGDDDDNE